VPIVPTTLLISLAETFSFLLFVCILDVFLDIIVITGWVQLVSVLLSPFIKACC
jgi:hypothetical protein